MLRHKAHFAAVLVLAVIAACAVSCERKSAPGLSAPSTQHSSARIVCLSPALAVTLKDLGFEDRIVGRHGYDMALSPALPVAGDQQGLNYETILTLNPTHVLLQLGSGVPPKLAELAGKHAWVVSNTSILTLDDIRRTTRDVQGMFAPIGAPCPLLDRMTAAWSAEPDQTLSRAGRILLLASVSPPAALGPGSFHHQILEVLGGTPAITTGNPYIELDSESLLAIRPDGIILILPRPRGDAPSTAAPAQLRARLGTLGSLSLPCLDTSNGRERLALIDDPLAHTPSSAMLAVTDQMREIVQDWAKRAKPSGTDK